MKRRRFLQTAGVGAAAVGTGCMGGGGEVVVSVQRDVRVEPQGAWIRADIPDVSDPSGEIRYIVKSETPFSVYFFTDRSQFERYDAYIKGREPDETPPGNPKFSQKAVQPEGADIYEASTDDGGAREALDEPGPYFFAVDYSNYRMETRVEEFGDPLTAFVDLTVIRNRLPF
ncbi:twin-arginine translocation signal domain-containing protein [Haloarcula brevis]|uniref:twin-arginine translocation signal domain-containing protein n=1 Tax=Haloarcula brevis TaxID=3111453 RepID=UPI00300EADF0